MSTLSLRSGSLGDAHHLPLTQAQRLAQDAGAAAELRAYQTHPDVVALRVERIRTQVDRLMWAGIVLGLCFTMTTVQQFAATGAPVGSLAWFVAWLLDPMVSLVLLAVLRAEQLTTRYQISTGPWPHVAKWALLTATYLMNTWAFWAAGSAAGVVLHSVPPLVVVIAAEAVTDLQYALTDCAQRAAHLHTNHPPAYQPEQPGVNGPAHDPPVSLGAGFDHPTTAGGDQPSTTVGERPTPGLPERPVSGGRERSSSRPRPRPHAGGSRGRSSRRRKLLADYLAEARAAWTPGVVVSPAWVRQVTDCSRGLSPKVAAALTATLPPAQHPSTRPEGRAA